MSTENTLADRYGRPATPRGPIRRNLGVIITSAVIIIAVIVWGITTDALGFGPKAEARDLGYNSLTDTSVTVEFELTATPGHEVACAIQAQNTAFAIVGWKVFVYPPSEQRIRDISETIITSQPATTGLVYRCWLT
ncbi:hypothetical protein M2118_000187 [Aurantimicrobium minutum]|uniref:DUF4307 domain-containing protein n=1 Tax=Aurantimicrobium minutum TaxID=708131 RepID=UPI0024733E89|nr:DUF4307 domain-containing protein [Aurantimicrobium minutum]MDH6277236.1 hypothetical protein [Aurantimicrobium minutum]